MPISSAAVTGEFHATPYYTHKTKSVRYPMLNHSEPIHSLFYVSIFTKKGEPLESVQNTATQSKTVKIDVDQIPSFDK